MQLCLENVLEEAPGMLLDILKAVDDPRLRMCLDVGHVHVYAEATPLEWLDACAPYISHFHIHNNSGEMDAHRGLLDGTIPMRELLCRAEKAV